MKIHLLGICGTGMSALAGLLKEKGHAISGSDNNFYPPVSEIIEKLNIKLLKGYKPENIPQDIDLVVIGNVISRGNPELEYILNKSIPFTSMPEALYNFFIRKNISIVIAGTHGKTTTTGLIAWGLEVIGKDPSFACGGVIKNFGKNYKLGKRGYFVIEGDEYETSFFDKGPKFLHYFPRYLILNAIEYDHADIFPSRKDYLSAFEKLINLIPEKGLIIYNGESPLTRKIIKKAWCETQSFGFSSKYTWWVKNIFYKDGLTHFTVLRKDKIFGEFKIPLIGD
ncbi:Mur ligase domain-containing protein, partial [Candidatus Aminicenantes bacterium AC-335-A11]|nr:Mur ligase domain-containing protein [Candidatus Aminicenantes bacterium AC-335-A11]